MRKNTWEQRHSGNNAVGYFRELENGSLHMYPEGYDGIVDYFRVVLDVGGYTVDLGNVTMYRNCDWRPPRTVGAAKRIALLTARDFLAETKKLRV